MTMEEESSYTRRATNRRGTDENVEVGRDTVVDDKDVMLKNMYPLLNSMRVFGLYFERDRTVGVKSCKCNPGLIYATVVLVMLWLNAARMFTMFTNNDEFGLVLLNKLIGVAFMFQSAILQTSFYAGCYSGSIRRALELRHVTKMTPACVAHLRRLSTVYATLAWIMVILTMTFLAYFLFFANGMFDMMLTPVTIYVIVESITPYRIAALVFNILPISCWCFTHAMSFLLAMIISRQFKRLGMTMEGCFNEESQVDEADLEKVRRRHQDLCQIVSRADKFLMFSNAAAFCCQLAIVIILLYALLFYPSLRRDPMYILGNVCWLAGNAIGLIVTAAGGILVNNAAHDISEHLHNINLSTMNERSIGKINVFLQRLGGDPIGFSVLGIFVIDKNTILTLLGVLITYFLLVVDLTSPSDSAHDTRSTTPIVNSTDAVNNTFKILTTTGPF